MSDTSKPISKINPQSQNNLPIGVETTLMDDPVALMDDPNALMGSYFNSVPVLKVSTSGNAPNASIRKRR